LVDIVRAHLIDWIYRRVTCDRSLGRERLYPFGCKTFREFLQEIRKREKDE